MTPELVGDITGIAEGDQVTVETTSGADVLDGEARRVDADADRLVVERRGPTSVVSADVVFRDDGQVETAQAPGACLLRIGGESA